MKLLGEEDVAELVQPGHRLGETPGTLQHLVQCFFQDLRVEKLLAVLPLVDGLGFIEALVALQANERQPQHGGGGLREFGLADAGRPFDQYGLAQVVGEIHRRRDLVAADVPVRLEFGLQRLHGLRDALDVYG